MDQITAAEKPHLVLRPLTGWQALSLRELWPFRDLLRTLAMRDVKLRYRQTALGVLWVVLQPLLAAGIFSFVFGRVAKLSSDGVPYFLFSYAGLLGWNAFNSVLTRSSGSLVQNSQLISKVFFPRLMLPLSTLASALIDFLVAFALLLVLLPLYHILPTAALLLLPVWLLLLMLMALGLGLIAAALMVSYRDVMHILPVLTQFLMYASPVAYAVSNVPQKLRALYFLNPLTGLLEAFRWSVIGRGTLQMGVLLYSTLFALGLFVFGAYAFKTMERKFADVI
jgi:lipopolysaccharide transport system permease protein